MALNGRNWEYIVSKLNNIFSRWFQRVWLHTFQTTMDVCVFGCFSLKSKYFFHQIRMEWKCDESVRQFVQCTMYMFTTLCTIRTRKWNKTNWNPIKTVNKWNNSEIYAFVYWFSRATIPWNYFYLAIQIQIHCNRWTTEVDLIVFFSNPLHTLPI